MSDGQRRPAPVRWTALSLLVLAAPAAAAPYARFAGETRLNLPVSIFVEAPAVWTSERVSQAFTLADRYMDRCAIDLEWSAPAPLRPGDVNRPERLFRTASGAELTVVLRGPGDARAYRLAGVANLWRAGGVWRGEAAWSPLVQGVAQLMGRGALPAWPRPTGPGAAEAESLARLALAWAVARGWATLAPAVAEGHCAFLRKRLKAMAAKRRPVRSISAYRVQGIPIPIDLGGTPTALLVADVPRRDAIAAAIRVGDRWQMSGHALFGPRPAHGLPAVGRGRALVQVGGARLLLSERAEGVHAAWWHPDPIRQESFRPPRWLAGCARVLAADALRPPESERGTGADPGTAVVVCPDQVIQLTPLRDRAERVDPMPAARWATLTRWGPARARLMTGDGAQLRAAVLPLRGAPAWRPAAAQATKLHASRPSAPIWQAPAAAPVQLGAQAIHGLRAAPLPLGAGAHAQLNPQLYRVARVQPGAGRGLNVDGLYDGSRRAASLGPRDVWATHLGDYGPLVWVLRNEEGRWSLGAPAATAAERARVESAAARRAALKARRVRQRAKTTRPP
jgi:hypothetical protein